MVITQDQLDIYIANAQCCASQKTEEFKKLKDGGDVSWFNVMQEAVYLTVAVQLLSDYDITSDCLTEDELCVIIKNIGVLCSSCGC